MASRSDSIRSDEAAWRQAPCGGSTPVSLTGGWSKMRAGLAPERNCRCRIHHLSLLLPLPICAFSTAGSSCRKEAPSRVFTWSVRRRGAGRQRAAVHSWGPPGRRCGRCWARRESTRRAFVLPTRSPTVRSNGRARAPAIGHRAPTSCGHSVATRSATLRRCSQVSSGHLESRQPSSSAPRVPSKRSGAEGSVSGGIPVGVTYHPSFVLRFGARGSELWRSAVADLGRFWRAAQSERSEAD